MVAKKRGLGRGLEALLPRESSSTAAGEKAADTGDKNSLNHIPVEFIQPGRYQPRSHFDDEAINDLAASIRAQGLMQPIVLRKIGENRFEIIAGERRWRAAQRAEMDKIPALVREVSDEAALAMSLIENIQREDLNPLEEAVALQRLIDEFGFTHQQVADSVGKSRSSVSNILRLTNLAPTVADMLAAGDLDMGHARALLALQQEDQPAAAREIAARGLNVRQSEALVKDFGKAPASPSKKIARDADVARLEERLGQLISQPVEVKHSPRGKGKLVISYSSLDELDGILGRLGYEE